jgi:hypothetical protein
LILFFGTISFLPLAALPVDSRGLLSSAAAVVLRLLSAAATFHDDLAGVSRISESPQDLVIFFRISRHFIDQQCSYFIDIQNLGLISQMWRPVERDTEDRAKL